MSAASGDSLDHDDEEGWEEGDSDEDVEYTSLFGPETFDNAKDLFAHDAQIHHFDLIKVVKRLGLEFLDCAKLVNYVRAEVAAGKAPVTEDITSTAAFADDKFLLPFLEDDALLFSLDDLLLEFDADDEDSSAQQIAELEEQVKRLQLEFSEYRSRVASVLDDKWAAAAEPSSSKPVDACADPQTSSTISDTVDSAKADESREAQRKDTNYFESYSYNDIHETMIKDRVRTDAYRDFIYDNKHLFAGKTVLDVGCGTGILSLFCARAGASKVIAVDNSAIINKARANVFNAGLQDTITCLRGRVEDIHLPVDSVDVIVSEWMGYCLLFEAMLDSVLWARDRYLKRDGLMVPSHCTLQIAPLASQTYVDDKMFFWKDVYGFDMSAMMSDIPNDVIVESMKPEELGSKPHTFATLALHTVKTEDLQLKEQFHVELARDIDVLDGWVIWFDTFFLTSRDTALPSHATGHDWGTLNVPGVAFTTGPHGKQTHWRSSVLLLDEGKRDAKALGQGTQITGSVALTKTKANARDLDVAVKWAVGTSESAEQSQTWSLS